MEDVGVEKATKSVAVQGSVLPEGLKGSEGMISNPEVDEDAALEDIVFDEDEADGISDFLVITEPVAVVSKDVIAGADIALCSETSEGEHDLDLSGDGVKPKCGVEHDAVRRIRYGSKSRSRSSSEQGMRGLYERFKEMSKAVQSRVRTVPEKDKGPPKSGECSKDKDSDSKILQDLKNRVVLACDSIRSKLGNFTKSKRSAGTKGAVMTGTDTSAVKASNLPVVIICVSIAACLILTSFGLYVWKTLTLTKENYESEMHKIFSELIDARAATQHGSSSAVIGESDLSDISEVSSSGMTSSAEESRVYKRGMDKLDLLSRITSVASMDVAIDDRYLIPVTWNNLTIFIPSDMGKYEVSFEPLTVSVDSSDLSLRLDLVELNKSPEEVVEDEFAEFQRSSSVSESVIELSKSEENRSFLQVTYKSALDMTSEVEETGLEDKSLDTESQLELSRNMYIAILRVTDGVGLRCIYDAGTNARVESQNVLYEALVANVADRFV